MLDEVLEVVAHLRGSRGRGDAAFQVDLAPHGTVHDPNRLVGIDGTGHRQTLGRTTPPLQAPRARDAAALPHHGDVVIGRRVRIDSYFIVRQVLFPPQGPLVGRRPQ